VVATAAALFGASSIAGGAQTAPVRKHDAVTVVAVLGPSVAVPYGGQFVRAYAYCPRGYFVTGGGAYNGAVTEIASSPTPNLRGWFVEGDNVASTKQTYHQTADAVCMKGTPPVTVGAAADTSTLHQAEVEAAASRSGSGPR
jgi:hypothetical protein